MKAFVAACVAIVLIAVGAHFLLDRAGFSAAERASAPASVRLD